jgi:hypothetical protein
MFPDIQRCHADQDLQTCLKYLLNYGFYKFGIEVGKYGFAKKYNETSVLHFLCILFQQESFIYCGPFKSDTFKNFLQLPFFV